MNRHSAQTKLVSLFTLAFICLNAGGAVCVAYCRTSDGPSPNSAVGSPAHHCEKAAAKHTGKGAEINAARELRPCPMTVSFFAGPVEKHTLPVPKPSTSFSQTIAFSIFDDPISRTCAVTPPYRGPPLLDRRINRVKQRLLLV